MRISARPGAQAKALHNSLLGRPAIAPSTTYTEAKRALFYLLVGQSSSGKTYVKCVNIGRLACPTRLYFSAFQSKPSQTRNVHMYHQPIMPLDLFEMPVSSRTRACKGGREIASLWISTSFQGDIGIVHQALYLFDTSLVSNLWLCNRWTKRTIVIPLRNPETHIEEFESSSSGFDSTKAKSVDSMVVSIDTIRLSWKRASLRIAIKN